MPQPETMFDKIVNYYVASRLGKENNLSVSERNSIEKAVRSAVLKDTYQILGKNLLSRAKEEANTEKRRLVKRFKITLIIETIFIAFLVGIIVNQVTNLIPDHWLISAITIIGSLLLCVLMLILNIAKE